MQVFTNTTFNVKGIEAYDILCPTPTSPSTSLSLKKSYITLKIHAFYVCPSTIETRFYANSKPEEITERLLKSPKITAFIAFNGRHDLLGSYWFDEASKTVTVNATRHQEFDPR